VAGRAAAAFDRPPALVATTSAASSSAASAARASVPARHPDRAPVSGLAASGIPSTALAAYQAAAGREARRRPSCGLSWPLLAGIGRVESNHGRFAGAVLHADGRSTPPVIGIPLDGHGTALIRDTDRGRLDGDRVFDRAVGPMQFIPSTWAGWGVDANGDGVKDPFNIFDAAQAAADYLCAAGADLTTTSGQVRAILSYNHSYDYVTLVMGLERVYAGQTGITVPVLPTAPATRGGRPKTPLPPVDPGSPGGLRATPGSSGSAAGHTAPGSSSAGSSKPGSSPAGGSSAGSPSGGTSGASFPAGGSSSSTPSSTPTPTGSCPAPEPSSSSSGSSSPASGSPSATSSPEPCPSPSGTASSASGGPGSSSAAPGDASSS
ncbi:MAG TPA: lytic transglycosylase domain-containing protein, partial [Jatrophihabitans sp.]|nr:lytic transglycosylase domain-containing protein [Jatrophihabitans sp.]